MTIGWNNLTAAFGDGLYAARGADLIGAWICIEPPVYGIHDGRWRWDDANPSLSVQYKRAVVA